MIKLYHYAIQIKCKIRKRIQQIIYIKHHVLYYCKGKSKVTQIKFYGYLIIFLFLCIPSETLLKIPMAQQFAFRAIPLKVGVIKRNMNPPPPYLFQFTSILNTPRPIHSCIFNYHPSPNC